MNGKRIGRGAKASLTVLAVLLALYLGYGCYLGRVAAGLAREAWVSGAYAAAPGWGQHNEIRWHNPLVVHWFGGARVWLKYDDERLEAPGGVQLEFALARQNGGWQIGDLRSKYPLG